MKPVTLSPGFGDNRPTATLYYGQDVRETLRSLPEASVHTIITSPPYWGLRDYGTGDAQIGLEETPEEFVRALVEVFTEAKRVLRPDGTLWVNLGDSYSDVGRNSQTRRKDASGVLRPVEMKECERCGEPFEGGLGRRFCSAFCGGSDNSKRAGREGGLKHKDLVGIPWRFALALQAEGWYLRADVIWSKPNPMPESVTDRPTKAHEYVFLFAHPDSGGRYFYDAEAVKEKPAGYFREGGTAPTRDGLTTHGRGSNTLHQMSPTGRNKRSVWNVNPKPYLGSHFAVWPPDLVEPMIRAGTSERGCCPTCGKPWERIVERNNPSKWAADDDDRGWSNTHQTTSNAQSSKSLHRNGGGVANTATTVGWQPTCVCGVGASVPCTVLDPFSGSATTGMVALRNGRNYIGIDLNPEYLPLAEARLREDPAPRKVEEDPEREPDLFDLFGEGDR